MIRHLTRPDLPALKGVIGATGLFPPDLLDDMAEPFLRGDAESGFWLTSGDGRPVALVYCAPERMTSGTWNLLLIAVHPDHQRRGQGAALMRAVEARLTEEGGRILLVETSGLPEFSGTRAFYRGLGYGEEARIRDYYQAGEDKVVFRKPLRG
jgi:ribosomal protein S18 acetylase RimI-like enzyme